jgi:hypothetical protein
VAVEFDLNDSEVVEAYDDAPLWSAMGGQKCSSGSARHWTLTRPNTIAFN